MEFDLRWKVSKIIYQPPLKIPAIPNMTALNSNYMMNTPRPRQILKTMKAGGNFRCDFSRSIPKYPGTLPLHFIIQVKLIK